MSSNLIVCSIAILGGIAVAIQGQMMGLLDRQVGTLESIFLTYGLGAICIALLMMALRGGNLAQWQQVPWWALSSGLFGLVIVGSIGFSIPRLGLVTAFTLLVAAQFAAVAVIDHFGLLGAEVRALDTGRLAGILILMLGVWLIIRQ